MHSANSLCQDHREKCQWLYSFDETFPRDMADKMLQRYLAPWFLGAFGKLLSIGRIVGKIIRRPEKGQLSWVQEKNR